MLSTANQAYVFLSTVYAGFFIGLTYDFYRMLRKITKIGLVLTGLLDLFFWLGIGALSFLVIFIVNDGEVRIYTIAGFAIGWALYSLTLSPYVMKILQLVYSMIVKLIRIVIGVILWPFKMLRRFFAPPARLLTGYGKKVVRTGKQRIKRMRNKKTNKNTNL